MSLLEIQDIQQCTDAGSFQRGEAYFKQHKVLSLTADNNSDSRVILTSKTSGSKGASYQQTIHLIDTHGDGFAIKGSCSCPVARNCKHVVAACLTYRQRQMSEINAEDEKLDQLLALIEAKKPKDNVAVGEEFIVYVLKPLPSEHSLSVHFMVCRAMTKGGVTRGRQVRLQQFTSTVVSPKFAEKIDTEIGQLLSSIEGKFWNDIPLIGETGFKALNKILSTNRCYWERVAGLAITPGERRPGELKLEPVDKRHVKLKIQIEPPTDHVLQISPAMYLDLRRGTIGHLQGITFTPHQWQLFNEMPLIPANQAEKLSLEISKALSTTTLSTPEKVDAHPVAVQPTPVLHLFQKNIGDESFATFMRLRFRYDSYEITALPKNSITSIHLENRVVQIRRARGFEELAMKRLVDEGFNSAAADTGGDMEYFSSLSDGAIKSAEQWQHFSQELMPELQQEGWEIEYAKGFELHFHDMGDWTAEINDSNEWFDLRFDLELNDRKLPLLPIISEILASYEPSSMPPMLTVSLGNGEYIKIPSERIRPVCEILYELHDQSRLSKNGSLQLNQFDALRLTELEEQLDSTLQWEGGEYLRELGNKLRDFNGIKTVKVPKGLSVTLRDYQQQGLNWLGFLREYNLGGILADDMGLGKTIQTLAHLLNEKEQGRLTKPCLIIAPTSLMSNWRREAEKFTAELRILVLQGAERRKKFHQIPEHDLVLSTYPLLSRDAEKLLAHEYYYLALDEAQNIKNPKSKAAKTVRDIKAEHRLCLTGTPMENHLGELWAQFDFVMPGFLGNMQFFKRQFRTPIEKYDDSKRRNQLVKRVTPFMLRRKKNDVIKELPEKTEIIRSIVLGKKQSALYESIRLSMENKVQQAIASKGLARSHIMVLDALLKLRQTCCDPRLLSLPQAQTVHESAKLDLLMDMLPELLEEGRRVLLFSQFTTMLSIIEDSIKAKGIKYTKLTGQTRDRDEAIETFKRGDVDVFLISLKAGGVGLNLTEADTVIHYDPWWNPAAENQATDRAHRIGQNKAVFVYKLITENTLEEKILTMQAKKQALMDGVYGENQGSDFSLNVQDLEDLFAPLK